MDPHRMSAQAVSSSGASPIMVALKALRLIAHLIHAVLLATFYPMLPLVSQRSLLQRWSHKLLNILSIELAVDGFPAAYPDGALLVANHISWLDVFVINAAMPCNFIAKSEVRSWPVIGLLCRRSRTLFIVRNNKREVLQANQQIASRLSQGDNIALFPEGTTTSGRHCEHFHASLFQCVIDAGRPVLPTAIRYQDIDGNFSEVPAYIDDMTLPQSIMRILRTRRLHARLTFLAMKQTAGEERRALASQAHTAISALLERQA